MRTYLNFLLVSSLSQTGRQHGGQDEVFLLRVLSSLKSKQKLINYSAITPNFASDKCFNPSSYLFLLTV